MLQDRTLCLKVVRSMCGKFLKEGSTVYLYGFVTGKCWCCCDWQFCVYKFL